MPEIVTAAAPLRVLVVEDQPYDADLMLLELKRTGFVEHHAVRVATAAEFLRELQESPDVILCDYSLPGFSALEALSLVRERQLDIPFIIVSGSIGEETAVQAMKLGADDYLLKDRLGRLAAAITQAVEEKKLRAAARRVEEDLRQSEFKYRCLFEHLPVAAYLCAGGTGRIIDVNQRGEALLGMERAGILGLRLERFVRTDAREALLTFAAGSAEPVIELASEIFGAGGQTVPVQINATVVPIYNRRLLLTFVRPLRG